MKTLFRRRLNSLGVALLLCAVAIHCEAIYAGPLSFVTQSAQDWKFIQEVGGVRISCPLVKDGNLFLPVACDVSGLSEITCKPTHLNSALVVRKIKVKRQANDIVIQVVTSLSDKDAPSSGGKREVPLPELTVGAYRVYYGQVSSETFLGTIEIAAHFIPPK